MSIQFGIIITILFLPILLLCIVIFYLYGGENGYNKYCDKSNTCSDTVRCRARSVDECTCFKPKKKNILIRIIDRIRRKDD